jgi:hypothetical protein
MNKTKWYKMVQKGTKWYKMVQNGTKWYKMVQNGAKLFSYKTAYLNKEVKCTETSPSVRGPLNFIQL